ncbi:DUF2179 domain-containing protein [Holdemanella biformis]|uniref:DUF2179 domain-containing protein n=1 Tax=Holdemanella biformis TaxID=1735 RepID=UPI003F582E6F
MVNRYQVNRMKEQVHEIDSKAYIIMSEVADFFLIIWIKHKEKWGIKFPPLVLSIDFLMHR